VAGFGTVLLVSAVRRGRATPSPRVAGQS
jgi:hypothetical protein